MKLNFLLRSMLVALGAACLLAFFGPASAADKGVWTDPADSSLPVDFKKTKACYEQPVPKMDALLIAVHQVLSVTNY